MARRITRRDFMNGVAMGTALSTFAPARLWAAGAETGLDTSAGVGGHFYPPTLTGMRGSHEGSFEVAHALAWRGEKPMQ